MKDRHMERIFLNVGHDERSGREPDIRPACPVASTPATGYSDKSHMVAFRALVAAGLLSGVASMLSPRGGRAQRGLWPCSSGAVARMRARGTVQPDWFAARIRLYHDGRAPRCDIERGAHWHEIHVNRKMKLYHDIEEPRTNFIHQNTTTDMHMDRILMRIAEACK